MPRYFFHILDGPYHIDEVGADHPGLDDARNVAVQQLLDLMKRKGRAVWDVDDLGIWVTDDKGATLFTLDFRVESAAALARFTDSHAASRSPADHVE